MRRFGTQGPVNPEAIHKQTGGQPFLVNRFAQILTEEMGVSKTETITLAHFPAAHIRLLEENNTNLTHLTTNIRRNRRFENFLMQIVLYEEGVPFNTNVNGAMYMEVPTGRGRMDLIVLHNQQKHIIETKIWRSERHYTQGKHQLAAYLSTEGITEGYYFVFDHRELPEKRTETETIDGLTLRSYIIPVVQERPSRE